MAKCKSETIGIDLSSFLTNGLSEIMRVLEYLHLLADGVKNKNRECEPYLGKGFLIKSLSGGWMDNDKENQKENQS